MLKEKKTAIVYAAYIIAFFGVWAALTLLVFPVIDKKISYPGYDLLKEGIFKVVVWAIPALLLMRKYRDRLSFRDGLFRPKKSWLILLPGIVLFTVYLIIVKLRTVHTIALADNFTPWLILIYLSVGFNEEIVFRGWMLNSTIREDNKTLCIGANAALFLLIHFPTWIQSGTFQQNITSGGFVVIIMLSVIFSFSFTYSKSIVVPALMHFWWDLLLVSLK